MFLIWYLESIHVILKKRIRPKQYLEVMENAFFLLRASIQNMLRNYGTLFCNMNGFSKHFAHKARESCRQAERQLCKNWRRITAFRSTDTEYLHHPHEQQFWTFWRSGVFSSHWGQIFYKYFTIPIQLLWFTVGLHATIFFCWQSSQTQWKPAAVLSVDLKLAPPLIDLYNQVYFLLSNRRASWDQRSWFAFVSCKSCFKKTIKASLRNAWTFRTLPRQPRLSSQAWASSPYCCRIGSLVAYDFLNLSGW